ncbi:MAG: hypothetical protein ABI624_22835 [Casimicrobiaceae bacterium]
MAHMRKAGNFGFWLVASCLVAGASGSAWAGATKVYKCFDRNLAILYTDEPCKGEEMTIRAGEADPAAVAELQRERDAVGRSAAQRIADNRRAALVRDYTPQWAYPADALPSGGAEVYYPAYSGVPYAAARRPRSGMQDARPVERERFVPNAPRNRSR